MHEHNFLIGQCTFLQQNGNASLFHTDLLYVMVFYVGWLEYLNWRWYTILCPILRRRMIVTFIRAGQKYVR